MVNHSFDTEHAKAFGLPEAILINNFQFWIAKNRANGRHQHEGRTWTYNSAKAMAELMPYLSDRQIRRTLDSLENQGVLLKGNYNTSAYDRTLWFAFVDESKYQIRPIDSPFSANGKPAFGDSETDVNTVSKPDTEKRESAPRKRSPASGEVVEKPVDVELQTWDDWLTLRKAKRAPVTQTVLGGARKEAEKAGISLDEFLKIWCHRGSQGLEASWLRPTERFGGASNKYGPSAAAIFDGATHV